MGSEYFGNQKLVQRLDDLKQLDRALQEADLGRGSTLIISGETGMGKTVLVENFKPTVLKSGATLLTGAVEKDKIVPFMLFSDALKSLISGPLFESQEYMSFAAIYAMNRESHMLAHISQQGMDMDADTLTKTLAAVQDFVRDSFEQADSERLNMERLEFGNMKVLIETGRNLLITGVVRGNEHPEMRHILRKCLNALEMVDHGNHTAIMRELEKIALMRFLVPKAIESTNLENERIKIADRVLEALAGATSKGVVTLVLEDVHWADDSALFVLRYLARNIHHKRILIICTMRPGENPHLDEHVEKMREEGNAAFIELHPFSKEDIVNLAAGLYGENMLPDEFMDSLAGLSGGNPLFVTELLKQMEEAGNIANKDGKYVLVNAEYSIPKSLDEIVWRRLETLDPIAVKMVEYASCLGKTFDTAPLLSCKSIPNPEVALAKIEERNIIVSHDGASEFSHALYRDIVYGNISDRWRLMYHKDLGEYFETVFTGNDDVVIYDLARHFSRSGERAKACDYCMRAGFRAESEYAPSQALELFGQALAALDKLGAKGDAFTRARLMEKAGDMQLIVGRYDGALASYSEAGAAFKAPLDKARMMRKSGDLFFRKGDYPAALRVIAEAKESTGWEHGMEYGKMLLLEGDILVRTGDRANVLALLEEARLAFSSEMVDLKDISIALKQIGTLYFRMGDLDESMNYQQQSLEFAKSAGDITGISNALNNIALIHFERGRFDMAINLLNESLRLTEKIGDVSTRPSALTNLGIANYLDGKLELALSYHKRALAMKERFGQKWGIANSYLSIGIIFFASGDLDSAMEMYEKSRIIWEGMGDRKTLISSINNIGEVWLAKGEPDLAMKAYSQSLSIAEQINAKSGISSALCGLALACIQTGDMESAMGNAAKGLGIATEAKNTAIEGKCKCVLGIIHSKLNEFVKAEELFRESIKLLVECDNKQEQVFTYFEFGTCLTVMGRIPEARENLGKAFLLAKSHGMTRWMQNIKNAQNALEPGIL